jgi:serine/threonine protein phosphatase PrpC
LLHHQKCLCGRSFIENETPIESGLILQLPANANFCVAILLLQSFNSSDSIFCGVFDGHGPYGHFVAKKVRDSLPVKLLTQWKTSAGGDTSPHQNGSISGSVNSEEAPSAVDDEWVESVDGDESEKLPEMFLPLKQSYFKVFNSMDKELKLHPTVDCFCSGSTAVTLVKQAMDSFKSVLVLLATIAFVQRERLFSDELDMIYFQGWDLVIGNLGDSRAIMGTRDVFDNLTAVQLTVDLKPNLPSEFIYHFVRRISNLNPLLNLHVGIFVSFPRGSFFDRAMTQT